MEVSQSRYVEYTSEYDDDEEINSDSGLFTSIKEHLDPLSAVSGLPQDLKNKKIVRLQGSLESKAGWSGVAAFVAAIALIVICCLPPVSITAAIGVGIFLGASLVVNKLCTSSLDAIKNQASDNMDKTINYYKNRRK